MHFLLIGKIYALSWCLMILAVKKSVVAFSVWIRYDPWNQYVEDKKRIWQQMLISNGHALWLNFTYHMRAAQVIRYFSIQIPSLQSRVGLALNVRWTRQNRRSQGNWIIDSNLWVTLNVCCLTTVTDIT